MFLDGAKNGWDPDLYMQIKSKFHGDLCGILSKLNLSGAEHILDMGSGDGQITANIADLLPRGRIVGIDNSLPMIESSVRNHCTTRKNLTFLHQDAQSMYFSEQFDIVFSNLMLHWIPDHVSLLRRIMVTLKPGGRILLHMPAEGDAREIKPVALNVIRTPCWTPYFGGFEFPNMGLYGSDDYKKWLLSIGFEIVNIEFKTSLVTFSLPIELSTWIASTWVPFISRIPPKMKDLFTKDAVSKFIELFPVDKDGKAVVHATRLLIEARKPRLGY